MDSLPADITAQPGLGKFNGFLSLKSYIGGFLPSKADIEFFSKFSTAPDAKSAPHVARWFKHIESFSAEEKSAWPASVTEEVVEAPADEDFGDDDDLFASDDGDDEAAAALAEKLKKEAIERGAKKLKNARSMIVLEVKPYEAEFDLENLAQEIKKIKHEGIQNWGQEHKLAPVAYGIKKLVISVVVFDELVSVDDLSDLINENFEDDVQSIDVQAMSKV